MFQGLTRKLLIIGCVLGLWAGVANAEIPDFDSRGWAVDPAQYGMTARDDIHAEMHAFQADFIGRVGVNNFYRFPRLASAEDKGVVSSNNDTIYSIASVKAREGFSLLAPNYAYTPEDGWSLLLRAYRSDVAAFAAY